MRRKIYALKVSNVTILLFNQFFLCNMLLFSINLTIRLITYFYTQPSERKERVKLVVVQFCSWSSRQRSHFEFAREGL